MSGYKGAVLKLLNARNFFLGNPETAQKQTVPFVW